MILSRYLTDQTNKAIIILENQMQRNDPKYKTTQKRIIGLIFLFLIVLLTTLNAQKKPSFIGIRGGASIPFGKYHSTSLDEGCFTQTGFNVSVEGAWFFLPKFGIGASTGINFHPVNVSALGLEEVANDPFLENIYIRSDPYQIITAMGGLYVNMPIYHKVSFTGKLLCGLLYGKTPYKLYKSDYYFIGRIYQEITSAQDWKFSWQAGVGLKYNISPCFGLVFDADLFYEQLAFNFNTSSGLRTDERIISFVNTTLGIRFNL